MSASHVGDEYPPQQLTDNDPDAPLENEQPTEEAEAEEPQLPTFFVERDEVLDIIRTNIATMRELAAKSSEPLAYPGAVMIPAIGADPQGVQAKFFKMELILARYQEAPTLLLPHLEELINPLLEAFLSMMPRSISQKAEDTANTSNEKDNANVLGKDYFEYDSDSGKTALHNTCRALYFVIKVAGPKACTSHLPHDVKLLEDVFYCLKQWQAAAELRREWEVRYCLLLWLSSLVLVPFSFQTIDSAIGGAIPLSQQLMNCAWSFLAEPSKCREAAAQLIARLNTRTDSDAHRHAFFKKAKEAIEAPASDNVLRNGVLLGIATTHKFGKREELVQYSPALIPIVGEISQTSKDVKTAKTAVKVLQRLGLSLLKQKSASWKYRQNVVSLEANLARAMGGASSPIAPEKEAETEEDDSVPDVIEDVVGYLLTSLSHSDTIVRWSAAKGIGRLCARLPKEMAADVVLAVIDVFETYENDSGWHGGLLALAELCRGSVLLPEGFEKAMPLVAKGLHYEVSKGSFSVGAHVRDAACYVCWSVARAYNPSDLTLYAHSLSTALITTALFDREVNVRRAAAAAFQECVGRLGNFPNGIDLVTTMDFFSLATRGNAYLSVAPKVATYDAYRAALMEHLFKTKLVHWDRNIRKYAAEALAAICATDPERAVSHYFPTLISQAKETAEVTIRHGSILAVAAMIKVIPSIPQADVDAAINIIPTLDSKRFFRGRGVEFVRQACCQLITNIAFAKRSLPDHVEIIKLTGQKAKAATKGTLQRFLEDTWKQPLEWLQWDAVAAFWAFGKEYYHPYAEAFHGKLLAAILQGTAEGKAPIERRGNAAALGSIPLTIALAPLPAAAQPTAASASPDSGAATSAAPTKLVWEEAFSTLNALMIVGPNKDTQDAETRRNAVRAVSTLSTTLGAHLTSSVFVECANSIFENSFTDYAVDKRGDVGSYARIEALREVPKIIFSAIESGILAVDAAEDVRQVVLHYVKAAVKQAVEKIDRVRHIAGTELKGLLTHPKMGSTVVNILQSLNVPTEEIEALRRIVESKVVDWASPQETFPLFVGQLLHTSVFGPSVMEGIPISVGGLSLHVLRSAQEALFSSFAAHKALLTRLLVQVAAKYAHSDRAVVPICSTIERLISHNLFAPEHLGDVVDMLAIETQHFSTDINRLLAFIPLIATLCQSSSLEVRSSAWHQALVLVASRYPKVRARMATELYTAVLMVSSSGGSADSDNATIQTNFQDAMHILSSTQWDNTDVTVVKGARDSLYAPLGLRAEDATDAQGALAMSAEDALRSNRTIRMGTYKSLVHEAGY